MNQNKIIEYLTDSLDLVITLTEDLMYPYKGFDPRKLYNNNYRYQRSLIALERKNLIKIKPTNSNKFCLTLKGKIEVLRKRSVPTRFEKKSWDGKWRILGFDIPEKDRSSRAKLREYLFFLGFKSIQKSIWATPQRIRYQDIECLFDEKTKEKIMFFVTNNITEEEKLKKVFNLT